MGFRYRKSINVGLGFRVNISKSGIGYSWGVPGVRFTKTATGRNRTTLSIPGTGISYVEESGGKRRNHTQSQVVQDQPHNDGSIHMHSIENANVSAYTSEQYAEFLKAATGYLSIKMALTMFAMLCLLAALFAFVIGGDGFIVAISCAVFFVILLLWSATIKKIKADYEMDAFGQERVALINSLMQNLQSNCQLLQVMDIYQNTDTKSNSGAGKSLSTSNVRIRAECPPFLRTKIQCYHIQLYKESLYLLPDKLIVVKGGNVGAIDWNDLEITVGKKPFVVNSVPKDATIIDETWQYVNKDGSRDRRYNNNHRHYVCRYGTLEFRSEQGFSMLLYTSNAQTVSGFEKLVYQNNAAEKGGVRGVTTKLARSNR